MLVLQPSELPMLPDEAKDLVNNGIYSLFKKDENEFILTTDLKQSFILNKDGGFKRSIKFDIPKKEYNLILFKKPKK